MARRRVQLCILALSTTITAFAPRAAPRAPRPPRAADEDFDIDMAARRAGPKMIVLPRRAVGRPEAEPRSWFLDARRPETRRPVRL